MRSFPHALCVYTGIVALIYSGVRKHLKNRPSPSAQSASHESNRKMYNFFIDIQAQIAYNVRVAVVAGLMETAAD